MIKIDKKGGETKFLTKMFKVQKKSGEQVDFDRNKVVQGVIKSGVTIEEAEQVAVQIEKWLPLAVVNGVIASSDIRVKVLEILGTINPTATETFRNYQKQKSV